MTYPDDDAKKTVPNIGRNTGKCKTLWRLEVDENTKWWKENMKTKLECRNWGDCSIRKVVSHKQQNLSSDPQLPHKVWEHNLLKPIWSFIKHFRLSHSTVHYFVIWTRKWNRHILVLYLDPFCFLSCPTLNLWLWKTPVEKEDLLYCKEGLMVRQGDQGAYQCQEIGSCNRSHTFSLIQ